MKNSKVNQVATFEKLLGFCNNQSSVYKPSRSSLQLTALNNLLTQAQQLLKAADAARIVYENAGNTRNALFKSLSRFATRIMDSLKVSGASQDVINDVTLIKRKLSGATKRFRTVGNGDSGNNTHPPDGPQQRSVSQLDFASRVENFERMVNRIAMEAAYKPNEADLQVTSLLAFATQLRVAHRNVVTAYIAMKTANRSLNVALYGSHGIHENGRAVKTYLRSVFGSTSSHYAEVAGYEFIIKV